MTLINRDEAIKRLGDAHFKNYGNAIMVIRETPTVDAVPVSLIQSEIDFLRLAAEGEMETNGCRGETSAELFALEHLLSVWENEKRKQNV